MKKVNISRKNSAEFIETAIENKDWALAFDLIHRYKTKGFTITLSRLKKVYKLSDEQIKNLECIEVKNPHYATAAPMKLFLIAQVNALEFIQNNLNT